MGITSIWNNDFFSNSRPVPKWCFEVNFTGLKNINNASLTEANLSVLNHAIESISIGRRETSIVKTYYCGVEANLPGRVMNTGELNIVFNENDKMQVTSMLEAIFADSCSDDAYFKPDAKNVGYTPRTAWQKNSKVIEVKIIKPIPNEGYVSDNNGSSPDTVIAAYEFYGCILTSINEEEFSYANTDDILKRTARFSYDYMIRSNKHGKWYIPSPVPDPTNNKPETELDESVASELLTDDNGAAG